MRLDDPPEHPGTGLRRHTGRSLPDPRVAIGPAIAPAPAQPEFELIDTWAPFPVEFGASWWLDPELATAEPEPQLRFAWAPFAVELGASWWLDPDRAEAEPAPPSPLRRQRSPPFGIIGSLGVHLLPLLLLLDWTGAPAETSGAIPVQLVLEAPPQAPEKPPTPTSLASEDLGAKPTPVPQAAPAPPPTPVEPPPPRIAAVVPPPEPMPQAAPKPAPEPAPKPAPKPKPPPEAHPAPPRPPAPPKPTPAAARPAVRPEKPGHEDGAPGPAATREDYLAQLVTLTRRHLDLLTTGVIAGRSGETVIALTVLADGTIAHIAIAQSSGYPDIDARVEQMVAAAGRFPPLPSWFHGASWDLDFRLRFPFPDLLAR